VPVALGVGKLGKAVCEGVLDAVCEVLSEAVALAVGRALAVL
jgi:hypothetical protein